MVTVTECGISIIAGGEGRRMGYVNKGRLDVGGQTMLDHLLAIAGPLGVPISLVTKTPADYADYPRVRILSDLMPERAPMVGIYTALKASRFWHELVLAIDLPGLRTEFLAYLLENRHRASIVIPFCGGHWEPLCAVYRTDLSVTFSDMIREGRMRPLDILERVSHYAVTEEQCALFGDPSTLFSNMNTPEDYAKIVEKFR